MPTSLHTFLEHCVDICFPPSTEARVVRKTTRKELLSHSTALYTGSVWTLSSYAHPTVRALVHEAKFHANERAFELLAECLLHFLETHTEFKDHVWIPIPLSERRKRSRGYNQVTEVLKRVQTKTPLTIVADAIVRTRDTRPQTELDRTARLDNLVDAFLVTQSDAIRSRHIALFDDVTTTGATLREARKAIQIHHPQSVTLIALSH